MVSVRGRSGFTLVELLVAMAVTIVALGLAVTLLQPVSVAFTTLPEAIDAQQRLRVAAQTLAEDVMAAGAGPAVGWGGTAIPVWPAVLPCRWTGEPLATLPGGCARDDALSVVAMPLAAPQAIVAENLTAPGSPITVASATACALSNPACRFHEDARVLIADGSGGWDLVPTHRRLGRRPHAGSRMVAADAAVPRRRPGRRGGLEGLHPAHRRGNGRFPTPQVHRRLGGHACARPCHGPAIRVLRTRRAAVGARGRRPRPSACVLRAVAPSGGRGRPARRVAAGENCQFSRPGGQPAPRQAALPVELAGLARLPLPIFTDGPWCPDDASPNRYDADLLRIRLVRITLRVQAQSLAVRGLDPQLFAQPGAAREAARLVPDLEVRVDAALRNR